MLCTIFDTNYNQNGQTISHNIYNSKNQLNVAINEYIENRYAIAIATIQSFGVFDVWFIPFYCTVGISSIWKFHAWIPIPKITANCTPKKKTKTKTNKLFNYSSSLHLSSFIFTWVLVTVISNHFFFLVLTRFTVCGSTLFFW